MKAVVCRQLGDIGGLAIEDVDTPRPGEGEILIDVAAAGLNFADLLMISGRYQERREPPFVPGLELAGRVGAVGAGVNELSVGQRVLAPVDSGAFAEKVIARANDVVPLPDTIDDVTAAGFAIAYGTSHGALEWRAHLQPGERLLVHGAAGGVGLTAVEIGKRMGAHVTATARGDDKLAVARSHGADEVIDSGSDDLVGLLKAAHDGAGFDVVYDPVGGAMFDASLRAMAWEGRLLCIGFASGEVPKIPANILLVKNLAALGLYWGSYRRKDPVRLRRSLGTLLAWHGEGTLKPLVSATFPMERVVEALEQLRSRRSQGKVVLTMRG
ncbi:MAG: NADPH:quinone oxidoreductase family protein [Geminicoccaceae bacterium]|nr:NADPH:quinone oxidoreductase family protein [Geminicoccaceae bacterium]MCB9945522.1 NADPH:quinone oxidoreductase family protein [Geminicoccaceae bacterium]